ncbi:EF-hand domain-containing protein [Herminiimonas fonticola]|uniref:EF hand domain-containing protein n=1 Tax=Herminiimonas fonticola TaxID=303380 RepID=A0A4R6GGQ9_9BURK|nr:EF-hand domain-containing protein [Herminiimonas fonticola]RBA24991.1 EF hand [Herminiimonas fonticola]TDN94106.1 EF hand domain-containing protein [Herminiimonas fonticola]
MNAKLIAIAAILLSNVAFSQPVAGTDVRRAAAENTAARNNAPAPKSITKSQAKAAKLVRVVENFERIDTNNDGVVTRQELRLYALSTRRHVPMT